MRWLTCTVVVVAVVVAVVGAAVVVVVVAVVAAVVVVVAAVVVGAVVVVAVVIVVFPGSRLLMCGFIIERCFVGKFYRKSGARTETCRNDNGIHFSGWGLNVDGITRFDAFRKGNWRETEELRITRD